MKNDDDPTNLTHNHTVESIHNKTKGNVNNDLPTTETNMRVDLLANTDKLITEDRRWRYEDGGLEGPSKHDDIKDNIYASKPDKPSIFNKKEPDQHNYPGQAHDNGPATDMRRQNDDAALSEEELMLRKLDILRKLAELAQAGVKLSQNYNMQSDYKMMNYEYELHKNVRAKQNGINWMSSMSLNMIYGIEMLNERYNPFDLKLKGWSEQMNADINNYYDVFGELYEKYNQPGKNMAPELKLLLMVSGSALKFHLTNTMMSNMPSLNDAMNKNPQMTERLRQQAVMDNKVKEQTVKNNDLLREAMSKEHAMATQKAADIQMIRQKEMDQLNSQRELMVKKAELEKLQSGLTINKQDNMQPTMQAPKLVSNIMAKNQGSVEASQEQLRLQHAYQKQQEDLYKKQLEALDAQKKAAEMAGLRMKHEYINELQKIQILKKEEEKMRASERSKSKSKDLRSVDSNDSVVNINSDLDKILNKSKEDLNKKVEKSIATMSDSRVQEIGVVNEEEISIGGTSKKSNKSKNSGKSVKTSVGGRKIKNNKVGISIL